MAPLKNRARAAETFVQRPSVRPAKAAGRELMNRILLIEDNHSLREEIVNVLELEGFTVVIAENGRVGLVRIEEERPDLVLCDLMMPDMDGFETLKAIRSNPETHTLPVIVLTARDDEECRSRGSELGADDYVTKPFKIPDLLRAVRELAKKRARRERLA